MLAFSLGENMVPGASLVSRDRDRNMLALHYKINNGFPMRRVRGRMTDAVMFCPR